MNDYGIINERKEREIAGADRIAIMIYNYFSSSGGKETFLGQGINPWTFI